MMKEKIIEFKYVILTLVICIAVLGVSKLVCSVTDGQYATVSEDLSLIRNKISSISTQTSKEVHITKPFTDGLDKERWKTDNHVIYNWIADAFTFNDVDEYNEHRKKYIDLLGETNQFITEILIPCNIVASDKLYGRNISSSITSLKSYVVNISDDGSYSYLAILKRTSTNLNGTSISDNILLTYSIDADGNVSNFHAATPKIDNR